jgi:(1->4)-alpha-D-glucan 1-alpha-D-glucosylmutase
VCSSDLYPLRIESYVDILSPNLPVLREQLGPDDPDYIKFVGIIFTLKGFPCQELSEERSDQVRFIKGVLWEIYNTSQPVREFIDRNLRMVNGEGRARDLSFADQVLYNQFFRLSYWKVASEEINYRRFFSINDLISLKMEDPEVFERCHRLIFSRVLRGDFTGLRVDHIDGLVDPLRYLNHLRDVTGGIYTVVEKILAFDEDLPSNLPVQGTTGYDYLNVLNGIFCRRENEAEFDRIYSRVTGGQFDREELLYNKKALIVEHFMTGDVDNLAHLMKRISSKDRGGGDITLHGLRRAIFEVLALFPVYRTYASAESFTGTDRRYISEAVEKACGREPELENEINYLAKFLLLKYEDYLNEEEKNAWLGFAMRFQQFTGPLMAKGFEDTLLYVYNRLVSLNEVGGDPFRFGTTLDEFHNFNRTRSENWPHAMNATSTHDTKRGEDVRARINVLTELPGEWEERVKTWRTLNAAHKSQVNSIGVPSPNDEYLLYQTLVGAYPLDESEYDDFAERTRSYVIKATREAKIYTGWIKPDTEYESAFETFVDKILDRSGKNEFLEDFVPFQAKVAHYGMLNSLSQVLLKCCSPGVPDFYQGSELWDLSLVDPDNRRRVDFGRRISMLESIRRERGEPDFFNRLMKSAPDGRMKLLLVHACLGARRQHKNLFKNGGYIPPAVKGEVREHIAAFARKEGTEWAIAAAPRFSTGIVGPEEFPLGREVWKATWIELPRGAPSGWVDAVTRQKLSGKGRLDAGAVFGKFPAALLLAG